MKTKSDVISEKEMKQLRLDVDKAAAKLQNNQRLNDEKFDTCDGHFLCLWVLWVITFLLAGGAAFFLFQVEKRLFKAERMLADVVDFKEGFYSHWSMVTNVAPHCEPPKYDLKPWTPTPVEGTIILTPEALKDIQRHWDFTVPDDGRLILR